MNPPVLNLKETALVLIDLQKGIVGRATAPHSGPEMVAHAVRLADRFRAAGAPVVLVHVGFSADGGDMVKVETDANMPRGPFPPEFSELIPEIGPHPGDIVILKRQWGAFHGTELDLQLRRRGIRKIVLGGVATHIGVESTARAAGELGYAQVFVEDAMTSMNEEAHLYSIRHIFPLLGLVRSTDEVLAGCAGAA
jgi:nicotinamidase-related amidase